MASPIICIVGKKKSGKTTFMEKLVPELKALGISVGTIKHDAHSFEMDHEGKDSWRHRKAGAETVVVSSPTKIAMIKTVEHEMSLSELAECLFADRHLILAEGFFRSDQPKIEVHRKEAHDEPLCTSQNEGDMGLIAMITNADTDTDKPVFGLGDAKDVAAWLARRYRGWVQDGMWSRRD
ncbi:MAG: molybdopterin-guanine dinucleotide biosynthesis protein B [Pseudodesulfovibrio sp.]|nr:molybdopterin-guanine dinucleotide biosynthesis protein B [Pseudodesulfovibrio sp.]